MHQRLIFIVVIIMILLAACQGPPPTQIILVVTATPDGAQADQTAEVQAAPTEMEPTTTTIPNSPPPQPSPTANGYPGVTINQIQVAEQVFENGRMFWIGPTQQIWVMILTGEGRGDWRIFEDSFVEGEEEFDPEIVPPEGLEQPTRGFGKLWRENPDLREALGWAVTPEFGFVTAYEYHPVGRINADNQWIDSGVGYHILSSLYEESFQFNEADQTWQIK